MSGTDRPSARAARPEFLAFANALRQAMLRNQLSASEVARRIWGTTTDKRGYVVARSRDRIGAYLAGTSYPEQKNLEKLARAIGVPVADLEIASRPPPPLREPRQASLAATQESRQVSTQFTVFADDPSIVHLTLNETLLPFDVAIEIVCLLSAVTRQNNAQT